MGQFIMRALVLISINLHTKFGSG